MANELTVTGSLVFLKGTERAALSGTVRVTVSGTDYIQGTQAIATIKETVSKGDIGTIGYAFFRNMDTVHFVELGSSTGVYSIKLMAGEIAGPLRWDGTNVLAKADTAPVNIEYLLIED